MLRVFDFQYFDPLTGEPPDQVQGQFEAVAQRARRQLKGRSAEEVDRAADLLSWLLTQDWLREEDLARLAGESVDDGSGGDEFSDVGKLRQCAERIDLAEQELLPGARWSELFALLALTKIADAAWWVAHYRRRKKGDDDWIVPQTLGPFAVEAMEAVGMAEQLAKVEQLSGDIEADVKAAERAKRSLSNQRAVIERHQKTYQLYRELYAFYQAGHYPTYAEAVRAFLETVPEARLRHLAKTNRHRTLRDALSAIHRGKRVLPD